MIEIRQERPDDSNAIRRINEAAFAETTEADVVEKLRAACDNYVSFVAVDRETVVGHILFTPVTIDGTNAAGMGLGPMAVSPDFQNQGIGSLLVRHGLDFLHSGGCPFVLVLGHHEYYPRFGFERASRYHLKSQWENVPDEGFLILAWDKDVLPKAGGIARYRDEFNEAI